MMRGSRRRMFWWASVSALWVLVFVGGGLHCTSTKPTGPKTCRYDQECGENERCIYESNDSNCWVQVGSCEGVCKSAEVPEASCACQKDEDCNYPLEGCGNCQCYKRDVQTCKSATDCQRGYACVGDKTKTCEPNKVCEKDTDCPHNHECRERQCCDPSSGTCPTECVVGMACQNDGECAPCKMTCKNGLCSDENTPTQCLGSLCVTDGDCKACNAVCQQGKCLNTGTECNTRRCLSDDECTAVGGFASCQSGCCR